MLDPRWAAVEDVNLGGGSSRAGLGDVVRVDGQAVAAAPAGDLDRATVSSNVDPGLR